MIGAIASGAMGLLGGGGIGGDSSPTSNTFGATNTTFGSVNFKSAGAGDRGKSTGVAERATEAALGYSAPSYGSPALGSVPVWLWAVGGLALAGLITFVVLKKK